MCTPSLSHFGFWTCSFVKCTVHILYDLKLASWTLYINALCICSILWGKTSFSHHTWGRVGTRVHYRMKTSWWRQFKALVDAMMGNLGFNLLQHIQYLNIVADKVHPFMETVFLKAVASFSGIMHCCTAKVVQEFFRVLNYPPNYPNFNQIGHLWDVLKNKPDPWRPHHAT